MPDIALMVSCKGMNNYVDSEGIQWSKDEGFEYASDSLNVVFTQGKDFSSRFGTNAISYFPAADFVFSGLYHQVIREDGKLYAVNPDWTGTYLADFAGPYPSCGELGEMLFCTDGDSAFKVDGQDVVAWEPLTQLATEVNITWTAPLPGRKVAFNAGVMAVAYGKAVQYSKPFYPDLFNPTRCYWPFDSNVVDLCGVSGGWYVGTETGMYFLAGTDPSTCSPGRVSDSFVLANSAKRYYAVKAERLSGECCLWAEVDGIMLGDKQGQVVNLTAKVVVTPVVAGSTWSLIKDDIFYAWYGSKGIAVNLSNFGCTYFDAVDASSFGIINGVPVGARSLGGLFEFTYATTDNGVKFQEFFTLPTNNYNSPNQKHFRRITLLGEHKTLRVTVTGRGRTASSTLQQGHESCYLSIPVDRKLGVTISNVTATPFSVNSIYASLVTNNAR